MRKSQRARIAMGTTWAIGYLVISLIDRSFGSPIAALPLGFSIGYVGETIWQGVRARQSER